MQGTMNKLDADFIKKARVMLCKDLEALDDVTGGVLYAIVKCNAILKCMGKNKESRRVRRKGYKVYKDMEKATKHMRDFINVIKDL